MQKFLLCFLTVLVWLVGASPSVHAQANLTFSGGNGTPLTLTLVTSVVYVIPVTPANPAPYFVFDGTGSAYAGSPGIGRSLTFQINTSLYGTINAITSNQAFGTITKDDTLISGPFLSLRAGDTITLLAGTLTTSGNFAGSPPADGSYATFLADFKGVNITPLGGIAVAPEPSTWAMIGMGALGACFAGMCRRQA